MLAFGGVAAQMLITGAGITGQVHDLCSGILFIAALSAGWYPPDLRRRACMNLLLTRYSPARRRS